MKTLVIGIDGASLDTFYRGWTPYIESLITNGHILNLTEDLLSRGWVEIFTGKHALETGALYDRPVANGSMQWTTKFNMHQIPGWGKDIRPIWQVLNEKGYSVGIMNIPTSFPAPKVDGFFVSGGGGGANVVKEATIDMCYPKDVANYLKSVDYVVDERMPELYAQKCDSSDQVVSRFKLKNNKRTEAFIKLSKEKNIDFGFIVYKTSSVMMEFFTIPELHKLNKGDTNIDRNMLSLSEEYYNEFDNMIKRLVETFNDVEVIFVSDHSETKTTFEVNINYFLQQSGFQKKQTINLINELLRYTKALLRTMLPYSLIEKIKKIRNNVESNIGVTFYDSDLIFDREKTSAFCVPKGDWTKGIYINDVERFGGIVPANKISELAQEISDRINSDKIALEHGIKSRVKPQAINELSKYYPDIILDLPDGYHISNSNEQFINPFKDIRNVYSNIDIIKTWLKALANKRWIPLTIRGNKPIAVSTQKWEKDILRENSDLTAVYRHIIRRFD